MAKALGLTPEEEHLVGIHQLARVRPLIFVSEYLTKSSSGSKAK